MSLKKTTTNFCLPVLPTESCHEWSPMLEKELKFSLISGKESRFRTDHCTNCSTSFNWHFQAHWSGWFIGFLRTITSSPDSVTHLQSVAPRLSLGKKPRDCWLFRLFLGGGCFEKQCYWNSFLHLFVQRSAYPSNFKVRVTATILWTGTIL